MKETRALRSLALASYLGVTYGLLPRFILTSLADLSYSRATRSRAGQGSSPSLFSLPSQGSYLNLPLEDAGATVAEASTEELSTEIQQRARSLFTAVAPEGYLVDFATVGSCREFESFVAVASRLAQVGVDGGNEAVAIQQLQTFSLATWINLHNALLLHGHAALGAAAQTADSDSRKLFFSGATGVLYRIGPFNFSLDDITHGILRGSPDGEPRGFGLQDPRRALAVAEPDPRVLFALHSGTKNGPPLRLFTKEALKKELAAAAAAYVEANVILYSHSS